MNLKLSLSAQVMLAVKQRSLRHEWAAKLYSSPSTLIALHGNLAIPLLVDQVLLVVLVGPAAFVQAPVITTSALAVGDAAPMFKALAVRAAKRT